MSANDPITETYFTFPDGVLAYDCAACGQRCCRGAGFAIAARELVPLLARAPQLAPHLQLRAGGTYQAIDLTERCWFLDGGGLCDLETTHGPDAKPSTCRLFPFNRVFRVGTVRVVDVNTVLCPVEHAPGRGQRHAALLADVERFAGTPMVDAPAWEPMDLAPDWLETERAAAAAPLDADPDGLAAAWARAYGVAGDPEHARRESATAARLSAIAPSLRWNHLFRKAAPPYPRAIAELPRRLRALVFLGALAARSLRVDTVSLRGLTELWRAQEPILDVLAKWDAKVQLTNPRFEADLDPALQPALGALLAGAFRGGKSLGELVEAACAALSVEQRPLAVALAARQIDTLLP